MINMGSSGAVSDLAWGLGNYDYGSVRQVVRIIHRVAVGSLSATERQVSGSEIEQQFRVLASRWRNQTGLLSSPTRQAAHPDYLRIIAMGRLALPFVLRELRDHGGQWYSALEAITGINPIPQDAVGNIREMKAAWLAWGESQGLV